MKALFVSLFALSSLAAPMTAAAADPVEIALVAGNRSHGWGAHEFNAGCLLMKAHLEEALGDKVAVTVHKGGWPKDAAVFQNADAIVLFMDGGGGHPINGRLDQLKGAIDRGCGLMCMHYAVEVPVGRSGKALQEWIGGYYESGWSINPHWVAKSKLNRDHPVSNGVADFAVKDEWYYNMRFREGHQGVTSILEAVPDDEARSGSSSYPRGPKKHIVEASGRSETLMWSVERSDGGRGIGFTGAHFHANFGDDGFRKLVINGVAWVAGIEIPSKGLSTHRPDGEELDANQDFKKPAARKEAPKKPAAARAGSGPKPRFSSKIVTRATPGHAVDIDVDVSGAKKLFLVVDEGTDGYGFDWADWMEPRLLVGGSETKLTDLNWKSATAGWGQVRKGRSAGGGELKVNGESVVYGIGTHANSVIEFDLPAGATRFKARGGIDVGGSSQNGNPSVQFKVYTEKPRFVAAKRGGGGGLDPADSLAALEVADGLQAELFASEPMILSPSSIDIDHRGRVWVAEIVNYRGHRGKRPEGDRILILEDTNGDGVADSEKVFYQGKDIDSPHGVCVLGDKIIVSAGEQVLLFTDSNGDDKPDDKKVLFNVIGGAQHDHGIHAFYFGPDGKLYFNFGNASRGLKTPEGEIIVDKAGNKIEANRQPYQQGMVFRCNMDGSEVETLGWNFRNNWEATVDSYGTVWQSDNDDDGNRGVRINFVMEFGNYGYREEFSGKGWRDKHTYQEKEVPLMHWNLNDPGVVPNLIQTGAGSPTGIAIYEGDLLPKMYHGQVIHCDAGPNVCRAYPRENDGAGYKATMHPILSGGGDKWYRPSDVAVAPDGSLLIADWYDPGVGGHGMRDLDRGRIFRVTPEGHKGYKVPKYDFKTPTGAAEALKSPNSEVRYLAWTALHGMGAGKSQEALSALASSENPVHQARALWCLGKMPEKGATAVSLAKKSKHPDIRILAIRLARQVGMGKEMVIELGEDADPQVRRECAVALRESRDKDTGHLWATLAKQHQVGDRWSLEALGIAAEGHWDECLAAWQKAGGDPQSPAGRDIVWRSRAKATPALLAAIVKSDKTPDEEKPRFMRAFDFLTGPEKDAALLDLLN